MNVTILAKELDRMSRLERRSLVPRLAECWVTLSWSSTEENNVLQRMVQQCAEHVAWLADLMIEMGEFPSPCTAEVDTTGWHYLDLNYLMPQLLQDKQNLIACYEEITSRWLPNDKASSLVKKIVASHKTHLEELQALGTK